MIVPRVNSMSVMTWRTLSLINGCMAEVNGKTGCEETTLIISRRISRQCTTSTCSTSSYLVKKSCEL